MKTRIYQLIGKSPLSLRLQSRDSKTRRLLYNDKEQKKNRSLRYASNQDSPFVDEQDDNFICEPIFFEDGVLKVKESDYTLIKFLDLHPDNKANGGGLFEVFDPAKNAQERIKSEDLAIDAVIAARSLSPDKMSAVIRVFTEKNPSAMSVDELKWETRLIAKNYPEDFLNVIDDPELENDDLAIKCINDGYVTVRNGGRDIHYNQKSNKKRIMVVPLDERPESALAAWFKTEDGQEFYQYLINEYERA